MITEIESAPSSIFRLSAGLIASAAIAGFFGILTVKTFIHNSATPMEIDAWTLYKYKMAIHYADTIICSIPASLSGIYSLVKTVLLFGSIKEYIDNKKELKQLNNINAESEKKGRNL